MEYLSFRKKYKLLKKFSSIFSIKTGEIFKDENGKCYKVKGWFSILYKIYIALLTTELSLVLLLFMYIFIENFIDLWWLNLLVCFILYIIIEVLVVALLPLEKVPCWHKGLDKK